MRSDHWRVLFGCLIAAALTVLLVRIRYRYEQVDIALQLRVSLEHLALQVDSELERGVRALTESSATADGWHGWELGPSAYRDARGRVPPIDEASLRRALVARGRRGGSTPLLGLFATATAGDAIVLVSATAAGQDAAQWRGDWEFIDELMAHAGVADLVKQGYRLRLYDVGAGAPLYQSDTGNLVRPMVIAMHFRDRALELRAAPRTGWSPALRPLASSLLVMLAALMWLTWEFGTIRMLRIAHDDLSEADGRRKDLTRLYGKALENLAALESRLQLVSSYDGTTGLANRQFLVRRLESALEAMRLSHLRSVSVMAIGFDHGAHIVSSFGAEFASRVLVIAADRIAGMLPGKDMLCRIGDFNLAAVLPETDVSQGEDLVRNIVAALESPITLDSHTFILRPSIGVAAASSSYDAAETLLDHAGTALGAVAHDAAVRYRWFDSATARASAGRLQLEADLDRAFDEGQLVLEFEPFVVPIAHSVVGYEALIRWNHPTEGRLMPGRFVPIALQAGMADRLNTWVMREAARQAAEWRRAGHHDLFINFNLSAEAFRQPHLVEDLAALLTQYELPAHQLVVELTESTLIQDLGGAIRVLRDLSDLGVRAWLDDFGTGYSSLSHLRLLPLKGVKIDRSFIEQVDIDSRAFGFLKALIDLISYLGMQSIAEGIETAAQYELLGLTTCDLYQGHYFARSMSAAEAERWMRERSTPGAEGAATGSPADAARFSRQSA